MTDKPLPELADDLELLRSAAVAAGITAAGYFRKDIRTWSKSNASPVTEADFAVDALLHDLLCSARPAYGWLSEETEDDGSRLTAPRVFVVDPIDGTRAFIRGEDSWTISIAIVEGYAPIAGVIFAPARDELYWASRGGGAFLNGQPIERHHRSDRNLVIPAPGAVHRELEAAGITYMRGASLPSLAYRLVQVARGVIDVAVARRGAQDWDIAAAALILLEAGIDFEDVCSGVPRFNGSDLRHCALAALADPSLKARVHEALRTVYGCSGEGERTRDAGRTQ
jgi:myo-inositol-1(or 4)-monophosphatase